MGEGPMPAISVIVPTRKRNHLLPRCLQSLYAQTFQDFEIILIDDNPPESRVSTDASLNGLLSDKRLRVIENPRPRNAAAARNCGVPEARGDWITYLDDDDVYRPQKLEKQLQLVRKAQVPLAACGMSYRLVGRTRARNTAKTEFLGDELLLEFPGMQTLFHRKTNVLFNEALPNVHDMYFYQELVRAFKIDRVCTVPDSLVERYVHHGGERVSWNAEAIWRGHLAVLRDFGSRYSERACQIYLLRARLRYCFMRGGMFGELVKVSWRLARQNGRKDARAILGAFLFHVPLLRPYLIG
jgi:glycosyltransferase involved in cell wall biosynthesis